MSVLSAPKWCGVEWPHAEHQWTEPVGMTGFYQHCPGSTGPAQSAQHDAAVAARALREAADEADACLTCNEIHVWRELHHPGEKHRAGAYHEGGCGTWAHPTDEHAYWPRFSTEFGQWLRSKPAAEPAHVDTDTHTANEES